MRWVIQLHHQRLNMTTKTSGWKIISACTLLFLLQALPTHAQTFPDKPIRLIVGAPAGAGQDVEARQFATQLSAELGQPVVVDNKPGFASMLGMEALTKAPADGYTLGMGLPGNAASHPRLYDRPLYNVEKDLAAVSQLGEHPWVLYVNSNLPAQTLAEFVALAKSKPGKITYASTGVGSFQHLTAEWFQKLTGTTLTHIPYGASNWQADLLAGNVDATLWPLITMVEHVKSGKLRALAISGKQRSLLLPDVPTFAEAKLPEYTVSAWFGLMAPAGLPASVLQRLNSASVKAVQTPAFRDFFTKNGGVPVGNTAVEFGSFLKSEQTRWRSVISEANIKLE
jgi:tripartite-type tricarboxylate transporter receptor subunit TctC